MLNSIVTLIELKTHGNSIQISLGTFWNFQGISLEFQHSVGFWHNLLELMGEGKVLDSNGPFVNTNNANVTPNAQAFHPHVCGWTYSPCYQGGCPPPRFLIGSQCPVQLTYAKCLMSFIINASQNLDSVNGQSRKAMDCFIRGTPKESTL